MQLVYYPDPLLLKTAPPLAQIDSEVKARTEEMFELMYREKGVGLAAPQVGWSTRLFIVNVFGEEDRSGEMVYVNPRILDKGEELIVEEEGCLSIPEVRGNVSRPEAILCEYQDLSGELFREEMHELEARVFQHELDHLNGVLFLRHLNTTARLLARKLLRELEEEYKKRGDSRGKAGVSSREP